MPAARQALVLALALAGAVSAAVAPARAAQSCASFMDAFVKAAPELKPQFVRPVVVTRGAVEEGAEARDLVTEFTVDARLYCRGERFLRFEAQIAWPAEPRLRDGFYRIQEGALIAGLRWSRSRAASTLNSMSAEAAEYLRASQERGDVFVSGKVERHAGRDGELGVVWTAADRSFILVSPR